VSYGDFVSTGGWKGGKEKGVVRSEGKEYVVADGDVMLFRFNV
jgi:ribosome-binding ATPase